jgi:protein tyrosine phosphatase (PTP) superfamily phosphohydrolase (DUF442 family)
VLLFKRLGLLGYAAPLILVFAFGTATFAAVTPPVLQGVGNFERVDEHVYRGAQPTDEGFRNLAKLGIKTVVDLREYDQRSRAEEQTVEAAGMQYVSVPMRGMQAPSNESVSKVLTLLEDQSTGPVFVHCMRGADRTGNVIACYRIEHDHWKNDRALAEARSMGMSWFEKAIQRYVLSYQPRVGNSMPAPLTASTAVPIGSAQ